MAFKIFFKFLLILLNYSSKQFSIGFWMPPRLTWDIIWIGNHPRVINQLEYLRTYTKISSKLIKQNLIQEKILDVFVLFVTQRFLFYWTLMQLKVCRVLSVEKYIHIYIISCKGRTLAKPQLNWPWKHLGQKNYTSIVLILTGEIFHLYSSSSLVWKHWVENLAICSGEMKRISGILFVPTY